ncbi:MAG TPA: pilus assembly protein N-terminal domain-containing protein [Steroidobacteraceae bacterium]|nr:pilus assembly protein N-terminal domain-containing protein [Steroidobacteraceae bacterium]
MSLRKLVWLVCLACSRIHAAGEPLPEEVTLAVGESRVLNADIRRAALGSGKVVSLATPERGQLLLFGEAPGRTVAQLWLMDGTRRTLRISVVDATPADQMQQLQALLAGIAGVRIRETAGHILLEGERISAEDQQRVTQIAALFPGLVLNLIGQGSWESMVQMDVRLVEVRRDQLRQLGLRWTQQVSGPAVAITGGAGAGNLAVNASIATLFQSQIDLLQQKGLAFVVAEPSLSCRSGGVARFVSGGEVPIPVTDGFGAMDVQYKEYGVILEVRPRADRSGAIYAEVDIELSQLDSSVRVADFPGFVKRRTSTAINVQSGETVAIAGLVAREKSRNHQGLAGLSSIPLAGSLFRSTRREQREMELLVLITPRGYEAGTVNSPLPPDQKQLIERAGTLQGAASQP